MCLCDCFFFFFKDPATTEIYTLSLHDALPILGDRSANWAKLKVNQTLDAVVGGWTEARTEAIPFGSLLDRKSTRLNSSHTVISYAVFCLKKKTKNTTAK